MTTAGSYLDWVLMTAPEDSELFDVKEIAVEALVGGNSGEKAAETHFQRGTVVAAIGSGLR